MALDEKSTEATTTAATKTTATNTAQTKSSVAESKFKKEIFLNNAKALGYEKYVVVGAFSSVQKDELTKSEFKEIMDNFLGKKVK